MNLELHQIYHVYNRGNNKQRIFFDEANYHYFLQKVKTHLVPFCDILGYSLMPNHFHFLIHANEVSIKRYKRMKNPFKKKRSKGRVKMNLFSYGLKQLLSSYAKGINQRYARTGSLFQQNTKMKKTSSDYFLQDYSLCCFVYIHNNPKWAGLVDSAEKYKFSSYPEYLGLNQDPICNLELAKELLCFELNDLIDYTNSELSPDLIKQFFK